MRVVAPTKLSPEIPQRLRLAAHSHVMASGVPPRIPNEAWLSPDRSARETATSQRRSLLSCAEKRLPARCQPVCSIHARRFHRKSCGGQPLPNFTCFEQTHVMHLGKGLQPFESSRCCAPASASPDPLSSRPSPPNPPRTSRTSRPATVPPVQSNQKSANPPGLQLAMRAERTPAPTRQHSPTSDRSAALLAPRSPHIAGVPLRKPIHAQSGHPALSRARSPATQTKHQSP
jgi:hypothetical protein